jgi:hypothetical protein
MEGLEKALRRKGLDAKICFASERQLVRIRHIECCAGG